MPTLDQADPSLLYILMKGEPGTRKSTSALSFPTPQYWFSWDRKMQSMRLPMHIHKVDSKQIQYDDYEDWNKPKIKLDQFKVECPYNTLIFDSITSMADMSLRQTRTTKGRGGRNIGGIAIDDIEDFNAESAAINDLIATTKDIQTYHATRGRKINIILIAHVMEVTYRNLHSPIQVSRTIVTAGKRVAAKIPAYCSEVWHFGNEKSFVEGQGGDRVVLTESTGDDFARTALPLPSKFKLGDGPFYPTHILPAINKLKG